MIGNILLSVSVVLLAILSIYFLDKITDLYIKMNILRDMFKCVVDIIGKANVENFEEMKMNIIKAIENGDLVREEDER